MNSELLPLAAAEAIASSTRLTNVMLDALRAGAPESFVVADALMARGGHLELRIRLALEAPGVSLMVVMPSGEAHALASTARAADASWLGQH